MTTNMLDTIRDGNGKLPKYTSVGCYPLAYFTEDGGTLCPDCANRDNGSLAYVGVDPDGCGFHTPEWHIVAVDAIWEYEDTAPMCDHCNAELETAYGKVGE